MIDYEKELNPEQRRVVFEEEGPLLIIAGAGSGKTRTLTYRVARLVESGVPSERILLATFTNKAARSMLSRVETLIGHGIGGLWGGTFHHCAHLTLRSHAKRLDYENNFSILDSEDSRQLLNTCIAETGIDGKGDKFPRADVIGDMIGFSVNTETPLSDVVALRYPFFSHRMEEIDTVAVRYRKRKKELNVMDFDDLLFLWRELLLRFDDIRDIYAERFLHVLVDEYQDTNRIQADIMDLVASRHKNLMVVGDDSQSIYSFRGANYVNMMLFPDRYPDCKIFKLETNYRSTPEILHLANLSIVNNENQFQKTLRAARERGVRPVLVPTRNVLQQADFIAQRILELYRGGIALEEIAVLYRAHYHSMEVQMELTRRGIPFEIRSGLRFFEQAHIKDVVSFLRVMSNPDDEVSWKRMLRIFPRIGKKTADHIYAYLKEQSDPFDPLISGRIADTFKGIRKENVEVWSELFGELRDLFSDEAPGDMISAILKHGYIEYLKLTYPNYEARLEDLGQLINFSTRYHSLETFLSELSLMSGISGEEIVAAGDTDDERVILSTIHQAKGLEWQIVFIIWCAEGRFPNPRAIEEGAVEEERRLFYVASTRAMDELYLTYPILAFDRQAGHIIMRPSRFLAELDGARYEEWALNEY